MMSAYTWIWRAVLAKLCVDGDAYTRLVAEADRGDVVWRDIAETLLTLHTDAMFARWAGDFDGLITHVESRLAGSLDACARDRGQWAPEL
jgi:hypothetical protein